MNPVETRKQKALEIINGFIAGKCEKPLTEDDLDALVSQLCNLDARNGLINAIKHLRTVTGTATPISWTTDYEVLGTPDGSNPLVEYMVKHGLTDTGTVRVSYGLNLQDAGLIVRFLWNNLSLLVG